MWGPRSIAKLVYNSNNYGIWYANNYSYWGESKPTYITGGPHIVVIIVIVMLVYYNYQVIIIIIILLWSNIVIIIVIIITLSSYYCHCHDNNDVDDQHHRSSCGWSPPAAQGCSAQTSCRGAGGTSRRSEKCHLFCSLTIQHDWLVVWNIFCFSIYWEQ